MNPGRCAIQLAVSRRRDPHAPEKGFERDLDAGRKFCDHASAIERNDLRACVREVVLEQAGRWAEAVVSVGNVEVDPVNLDFKDIARFGLLDVDWASQQVAARSLVSRRNFVVELFESGLQIFGLQTCGEKPGRAARDSLDLYLISRVYFEGRLRASPIVAPADRLR